MKLINPKVESMTRKPPPHRIIKVRSAIQRLRDYKQQCGEDYLAGKRTYPIEQVHTWLTQILNDIKLPTNLGI